MKANVPEKIYIQSFNIKEEDTKFDKSKMFLDDVWTEEPEFGKENIEYIRKDAFIEKAADYIANNMRCDGYTFQTKAKFIRDFKKYMED